LPEHAGAGIGGSARGEDVVQKDELLTIEVLRRAQGKSLAHVGGTLNPREQCLRAREADAPKQSGVNGNASTPCQVSGQSLSLVEFTFTLSQRMQRHRDDYVPGFAGQGSAGLADEEIGQERLETERPMVFVTMDSLEHNAARDDR
jgi:hypothetical protein